MDALKAKYLAAVAAADDESTLEEVRVALREARLLGRNAPSTRFFAALAHRFELQPAVNPTRVLLRP